MVAIENSNPKSNVSRQEESPRNDLQDSVTKSNGSPYEEPLASPLPLKQRAPQATVWPVAVGPAEKLMILVLVVELATLPFATVTPNLPTAIHVGSCLSLPSMLATWSSIRLGWWRYALAVVLSLFNGILLTTFVNPDFDLLLVILPLASALPVLLTLLIIKRVFGHFAPLARDADQFLEGLRFSLLHLFIVTTLLAILLPVGKLLWPMLTDSLRPPDKLFTLFSLCLLISFNTLMFVWALMGRQAILRVCITIPIGAFTLWICALACQRSNDGLAWYTLTGLPLVSSFLLMLAFRSSGWRFWKGK